MKMLAFYLAAASLVATPLLLFVVLPPSEPAKDPCSEARSGAALRDPVTLKELVCLHRATNEEGIGIVGVHDR